MFCYESALIFKDLAGKISLPELHSTSALKMPCEAGFFYCKTSFSDRGHGMSFSYKNNCI
jgi:hypothetical protein